ncbi:PLP-dependent aminotransferase family protein [Hazenella sp. IB182357]|uniref:PLP-dependent aminotransferase family protein n=1 Tax=Polycladospora coralii TaxID=2771432 RepID=A0A926RUB2_9BACL|nr:PLP-dependent aminotransferase family protein [Polycladospora coralii]MBD1372748.1 PLP-dependent aminotransferase family protein [Polycladospora coralii]
MSIPFIHVNRSSSTPLPEQVANQIEAAIRTERLRSGQSLPTVRELAEMLQVSRETVQKAYRLLQQQEWIQSSPRMGTTVLGHIANQKEMSVPFPPSKEKKARLSEMRANLSRTGMFPISGLSLPPDPSVLQIMKEVAPQAVEAALCEGEDGPFGLLALRSHIQGLLMARAIYSRMEQICIVNGTQQAISLIARWLKSNKKTTVAVPQMCYIPIKEAFVEAGLKVIPIRHQMSGMDVDHLQEVLETEKVDVLFCMPNGHYPTGGSWSLEEKERVLDLAITHGLVLLEDEYFGELYLTEIPPMTLKALSHGREEEITIFYFCSFTNLFHLNLRVGYVVVPQTLIEVFEKAKYLLDRTTSLVGQQLLLYYWKQVDVAEQLALRRQHIRNALAETITSLNHWLPKAYSFAPPQMGTCMWVYAPSTFDGWDFFERCLQENVFVMPDFAFSVDQVLSGFQVNYSYTSATMMDEAVKRASRILSTMK